MLRTDPLLSQGERLQVGVYVHIPFCLRRCTYCDFNTYTGLLSLEDAYVAALLHEIALRGERSAGVKARTLYFGGGTPSLLKVENIVAIVEAVRRHLGLPGDAEITLEANPGTLTPDHLVGLRDAGITRLSLGVQSSHSRELVLLGRIHTWPEAIDSYRKARDAGFDNINLDLMYGLPDQGLDDWMTTIDRCLTLEPEHLSLYALTLEPGTPLAETLALHNVSTPDSDLAADMYEAASEALHRAGFWHYEISNWARGQCAAPEIWALPPQGLTEGIGPYVSSHNLIYWRNEPWFGIGAGAHSWFRGRRSSHFRHPQTYINAIRSGRLRGFMDEVIPRSMAAGETMMMGLRLAEGVTEHRFYQKHHYHLRSLYSSAIDRLARFDLVAWDGERLRLTAKGRLLGNQVFEAFLPPFEGSE